MFLKEIKSIYHKELDQIYPVEEVDSFFYILIEHYLGLERFVLAMQPNLTISKKEEQPLFEALSKLRLQRPIQYITGTALFMDMNFKVDENVLIPRPETEELVRWVLKLFETTRLDERYGRGNRSPAILDIGTGSGCIAISLAKTLPEGKVFALDISEKALEVAQQNSLANNVTVDFIEMDILTTDGFDVKFDIIVSNPPYVRESEKKRMHNNVLEHEPSLALFVSDKNPLIFYKAIAGFAKRNLRKGGVLYLEINQYLAKETEQLFKDHNFSEIELQKDIFDNYRMLKAISI